MESGLIACSRRDESTPSEMQQEMSKHGLHVATISSTVRERWRDRFPRAPPTLKSMLMPPLRCSELKMPMTILAPVVRMPDLGPLIEKLPELTVVIDHMADTPVNQPVELEKLLALARYPKVFVKISHMWALSKQPYPWLDAQEHVRRLHGAFGPQRLMWATDWLIIEKHNATYGQVLSVVRDEMKFLNDDDKAWMLSKTIEKVWPFS